MFAQVAGVKNYFDRWAARYDRDLADFGYAVPQWLASSVEGERILDIGIGTGLCAQAYKMRHPSAVICGVDASKAMLKMCKSKGVADEVLLLDISKAPLPYGDNSFEGVMCGGVIEFMRDFEHCITEANRVLKPSGRFAVAFEGIDGVDIYPKHKLRLNQAVILRMGLLPHPRLYRKYLHRMEHVRDVCEVAGLKLVDTQHFLAYQRSNGNKVSHWLLVFEK